MGKVTGILGQVVDLQEPWCFLDSKVAYYWVVGEGKSWRPFVQNRVEEIRRLIPVQAWRHCPGSCNPADAPSRGQTFAEFVEHGEWLTGPEWLMLYEEKQEGGDSGMPNECAIEMKNTDNIAVVAVMKERLGIGQILDVEKYSDIKRLLCVTAYVLQFVQVLREREHASLVISPTRLEEAEREWIKWTQLELTQAAAFHTWKVQLGLFVDHNGIWRCCGRLQYAGLSYSTQHPVVLPPTHHFTLLLVRQAHERVHHNGVKETLAELRAKYWVLKGRSMVKKALASCVLCRRMQGLPYAAPDPPPLPSFRVNEAPPFTHVGVDFAGPLFVKRDKRSQCTEKVWICLYTCCVVRAVHLDLVLDLTTKSFMRCFHRFVARRGLPKRVVSDNGKTFKGAAKVIRTVLDHNAVRSHFPGRHVEWLFNVERAPWWGGLFERLVQSTKRCLRKTVGRAKLTYDELLTVLLDIELVLNSRPLSVVSPTDVEEPLTPSHLIVGRRLLSLPDFLLCNDQSDKDYEVTPMVLSKRVKFLSRTVDHFWKRWQSEYFLELRNNHLVRSKGTASRQIALGDVVVVHDENERRGFWNVGIVEKLLPGRDGKVRGAKVRVARSGRVSLWGRPIQRLYPLEVNREEGDVSGDTPGIDPIGSNEVVVNEEIEIDEGEGVKREPEPEVTEEGGDPVHVRRSVRAAAVQARNRARLGMKQ